MRHRFSTTNYVNTHGVAPRGRGSWGFEKDGRVIFAPDSLTLTQAKAWVRTNLEPGDWSVAA